MKGARAHTSSFQNGHSEVKMVLVHTQRPGGSVRHEEQEGLWEEQVKGGEGAKAGLRSERRCPGLPLTAGESKEQVSRQEEAQGLEQGVASVAALPQSAGEGPSAKSKRLG